MSKHSRGWHKAKKACRERDHYQCVWCGGPDDSIDHKIPKRFGGTDDLENLQTLCFPCHALKSEVDLVKYSK